MQQIDGQFRMKLWGIPFFFVAKTILDAETQGKVYTFHIGPVVIGWTWPW